jgi:hypothetical protein
MATLIQKGTKVSKSIIAHGSDGKLAKINFTAYFGVIELILPFRCFFILGAVNNRRKYSTVM